MSQAWRFHIPELDGEAAADDVAGTGSVVNSTELPYTIPVNGSND